MRDKPRMLLGLVILAVAVGGAAPWRSLLSYLLGKWEGITVTDPNGEVVGPEDPNDWGCLSSGASGRPASLEGGPVPVPPPTGICLRPAAPNPTSGRTTLNLSIPSTSQVSLVV